MFFIIRNNYKTFTKIENINYNYIEGNGKNLTDNLIKILIKKNIDILIYQFKFTKELNILIKLNKPKIIYINHSCFLLWIYIHRYNIFNDIYEIYKKAKYIVSIVKFENYFLFRKWGINSIYMDNLITYDYEKITPSSLSSNLILILGRANDKIKRVDLGIKSMKYILKEIPDCEMKIISNTRGIKKLKKLINRLKLENNVKFTGFTKTPEKFFNNASLHIFPSISEAFPMALCETKIYGIPSIITGIDYISISEGGVINVYDDKPETIAREAIKILKNTFYKKKLGKQARRSMRKFNNKLTVEKWIKLIVSVYKGENYYQALINAEQRKYNDIKYINQFKKNLKLLKKRKPILKKISLKKILNFDIMKNFSFFISQKKSLI